VCDQDQPFGDDMAKTLWFGGFTEESEVSVLQGGYLAERLACIWRNKLEISERIS
jgi:hypothetical protein